MSKEQAIKFLTDYKANRALMEKVDDIFEDNPGMPDNELWVLAAKECGYQFTPEELEEVFHKQIQEQVAAETKAAAAELDDAELSAVAGGDATSCTISYNNTYPDQCKDTFTDRENCWHNDGCDNCYNMYPNYKCKRSGVCDSIFTHR